MPIVDQVIRAIVSRRFQLLVVAAGGDHRCTEAFADFHRRQPDAARCAMYEQHFSRLQSGTLYQRMIARAVGHHEAGGFRVAHRVGDRAAHIGPRHHFFRHAAMAQHRHDPLPDR